MESVEGLLESIQMYFRRKIFWPYVNGDSVRWMPCQASVMRGHNLIGISGKFAFGGFRTRLSLLAQYPRRRSGTRDQGRSREARHFWENRPSWNSWYELHSLLHIPPIYSRVNQQRRVVEEK